MTTATRLEIPTEEVDAAVHARRVLGEDSETGVIDAFLERTARAIDTRVDARLAAARMTSAPTLAAATPPPTKRRVDGCGLALGLGTVAFGIPLTAISTQFGAASFFVLVIIWAAIAVVNVSYNLRR